MEFEFDSNKIEDRPENLPDGEYLCVVKKIDLAPAKSNPANTRLNITFQIVDGENRNREVWEGLNIKHVDPKVQLISEQILKKICSAVGVLVIKSAAELQQLVGKMLYVRVKSRPRKDDTDKIETKPVGYGRYGSEAPAPVAQQASVVTTVSEAFGPASVVVQGSEIPAWLK